MRTSDLGLKAGEDPSYPHGADVDFDRLVRLEQLAAVRKGVLQALPVNVLLGLAGWAVSIHAGNGQVGLLWLLASSIVNAGRAAFCLSPCAGLTSSGSEAETDRSVERHLRLGAMAALASGLVWACLPLLCAGYTSPQTLFYLTVTCGITAGAVTYGTSYARIPVCFVTPPLLSVACCLFAVGGFDRLCLGLTVVLYLAALVRGTFAAERSFRDASRSKNEARAAAASRELARAEASALATEMEWRATHDDLTTLLNRAGFTAVVEAQLSKGAVRPCLMLIDLDGFKSVNDIYGHETGDRVLREVAWRLRAALPAACLAGRLGGDEFAVFLDADRVAEPPARIAERLVGMMAHPFDGFDVGRLGLSVGVNDGGERDLTRMLSCADEALYAAKNAGRNRYQVFDESLGRRLAMRRDVKRDLAEALEAGQTEVWFQPIFGQGGRTLNGFEALLRWRHPNHGWISPAELVVLAGMRSLADPLLRFVLERVCQALQAFREAGRTDLRIGMNVSPREMAQLPVDEIVLAALRRHGLRASMLEIEITEETAADIEAVRDKLVALSRAGIRIALDDFGAGYSSLASIRQLYAERIKIDRSLVAGLARDDGKHRLVEAVLSLGQSLGLDIVAEGVETSDDLAALRAAGCQSVQGYHLGRPMPLEEALRLLPNRTAHVA